GDLDHGADRPGPVGVEAGGRLAGVPAKHEIDADLVGLNGVESARDEPDENGGQNEEQNGAAAKTASGRLSASQAARGQLAQSLLYAAEDLFEISRRRTRGPLTRWSSPGRAPRSAALIVPGHQIRSLAAVRRTGAYIGKSCSAATIECGRRQESAVPRLSRMSPTISSMMSSRVTRPCTTPYSSSATKLSPRLRVLPPFLAHSA